MFEESFLINLLLFVGGQVAAYGYLRTGRRRRGLLLMVVGWLLVDVVLVVRFAFEHTGWWYLLSLTLLQTYSLAELVLFGLGRIRRRMARVRQARNRDFRTAYLHYLRNELQAAVRCYRRILARDP